MHCGSTVLHSEGSSSKSMDIDITTSFHAVDFKMIENRLVEYVPFGFKCSACIGNFQSKTRVVRARESQSRTAAVLRGVLKLQESVMWHRSQYKVKHDPVNTPVVPVSARKMAPCSGC